VLDEAVRMGVDYVVDAVVTLAMGSGRVESVLTRTGNEIRGDVFIFACGAWLAQLFPELLDTRIFPTRQEVFYFEAPAGTREFRSPALPVWLHHGDEMYGLPDVENHGVKIASDRHGDPFDPETGERIVGDRGLREVRAYLRSRLPELRNAALLESRVCQYENTSNGDFLIDRHPETDNVWLIGGGSGHGFKHGPAVGQYVAGRALQRLEHEDRFSIERKLQVQHRAVY
jgi:glycine/D-amino acid oxidase-like deaminating enzyme